MAADMIPAKRTRAVGAYFTTPLKGKIGRACPRCGAAPGWRCGRDVTYKDVPGGPVWKPIKEFHKER